MNVALPVVATVFFLFGFVTGFLAASRIPDDYKQGGRFKLATFITAVWALSVVSSIAIPEYSTSIYVHLIMGGIVGYLFGVENPITSLGGGQ